MPQILLLQNDSPEESLNVVWGHMQFPEGKDRAFELFVRLELERYGIFDRGNNDPVTVPASFLKAMMNGHSRTELTRGNALRGRAGVTAGLVLLNIRLASTKSKRASLNGGIEVLMQTIEKRLLPTLDSRPYRNKPEILKAWHQMSLVSHLWAAHCMAQFQAAQRATLAPEERAARLLVDAIGFQQWATSVHGAKKPLLDPDAAWCIPEPAWMSSRVFGELPDELLPMVRALIGQKPKR